MKLKIVKNENEELTIISRIWHKSQELTDSRIETKTNNSRIKNMFEVFH